MSEVKDSLKGKKNARMITVRFFSHKANNIFERTLIVKQTESIPAVIQYFIDSIGDIDVQHYAIKEVVSVVKESELEIPTKYHRLEHFWGDVVSYIIEYHDALGELDEFVVIANVDCDLNLLFEDLKLLVPSIRIVNIYEYKDCWIKRKR